MLYEHKLEMDTCGGDTANVTVEFEADRPLSGDTEVKGIYYLESDEPLDSEDILNKFKVKKKNRKRNRVLTVLHY